MSHGWDFYECVIDDARAFVAADLDLRDGAPDPARPYVVRVKVDLQAPRPDGLPSHDERPRLDGIEDLLAKVYASVGGVHAGRASFAGAVRHYFYVPTEAAADRAASLLAEVTDRGLEVAGYLDPEWHEYLEFLYPNELGWQYIRDRKVLDALSERGDDLLKVRPIDHFAVFTTAAGRDAFAAEVQRRGFRLDGTGEPGGERPFSVSFSHDHDPLHIFGVTALLRTLATEHGGDYDGWGCPVTS